MNKEIYREIVDPDDPEIMIRAKNLVIELTQSVKDYEIELRVVGIEAIRGYLQRVAGENNGMIPVEVMNGIIDDALAGDK